MGPDGASGAVAQEAPRSTGLTRSTSSTAETFVGFCSGPAAVASHALVNVASELAAGLPVAVSFCGAAAGECTLIAIAHGYEAVRTDRADPSLPTF